MSSNFPPTNPTDTRNLARLAARLGIPEVSARAVLVVVVGEGIGRCYDEGGVKRDALDALARDLIVAGMEDADGNETFRYEAGMPFLRAAVTPMLASCGNGPPGGGPTRAPQGGGGGRGALGGVLGAFGDFFGGASAGAQTAVEQGALVAQAAPSLAVTALAQLAPNLRAGVQAGMQVGVNVGNAVLPQGTARIVDLDAPPPPPPRRVGVGTVLLGLAGVAGIIGGAYALFGPKPAAPGAGVRDNPGFRRPEPEGRNDPDGLRRAKLAATRLSNQLGFASVGVGGSDYDWSIEARVPTQRHAVSVPSSFEGFPVSTVVLGGVHAQSV